MSGGLILAIGILVIILLVGIGGIIWYIKKTNDAATQKQIDLMAQKQAAIDAQNAAANEVPMLPYTPPVSTPPTNTTPKTGTDASGSKSSTNTSTTTTPLQPYTGAHSGYETSPMPNWLSMRSYIWDGGSDFDIAQGLDGFNLCMAMAQVAGSKIAKYDESTRKCTTTKPINTGNGTFGLYNPNTGHFIRVDGDYPGHDIAGLSKATTDISGCEDLCLSAGPDCNGYFFSKSDSMCYPKKPTKVSDSIITGIFTG